MSLVRGTSRHTLKLALMGATILAGAFGVAHAQDAAPAGNDTDVVVVTGYRGSLQNSTLAKQRAVGFQDAIFAEDIGKFPDNNIAESFNRIPGVNISRDITGDGVNIAIRGLGTNFTRVLLNGAAVAVASTGSTDSQNTNREVDLDLFPTELFTQLTVDKSPQASMVEGGAAGTVNMRQARPFDRKGNRIYATVTGVKNSEADDYGYKASILGSAVFDSFGILGGISLSKTQIAVSGFETIGWTNANLSATQRTTGTRNATGGGNWTIPGTVPANAGNGLTTGATIDQTFLLAQNPGLTIDQIDNAIIPRLGRPMNEYGERDRVSGIFGLEWRPSDGFRAYLDTMYAHKETDVERTDMNWVGRNGAAIPINMKVDRSDCANGCVVTEGTFANSQFFLEYRPYTEETEFRSVNPGFEWEISDRLKLSAAANYTKSEFHRESPTFLVITPGSSGLTVKYKNDGSIPTMESNVDLNNPANFGWNGGRVNIQDEKRITETRGARADLKWGDREFNIQFGASYDDTMRRINAYDNSQAWQNAVCGNNPNVTLPGPNGQPPCRGEVITNTAAAIAAGYPAYPGLGTGFTSGNTTPLAYAGSLIPQSALASYLSAGPYGYVTVDWDKFKAASQYDKFHDSAPEAGSANTGASGGFVQEKVEGAFIQVNGDRDVFGSHRLRYNFGIRAITTEQTIGGRISIPDPRNTPATGPAPADGGRYPNIVNFATTTNVYKNYLPSASFALNVTDKLIGRLSASTTMTRANPNTMLPGLNFSSPSADVGTVGNGGLKPFISDNLDMGFEYYTGREGYFGVTVFNKKITGFTTNGNTTVPFSSLAAYGVTYDTLSPTQQTAINSRGGPAAANVVLTQQVNASGLLTVDGVEYNWVQPLGQFFEALDGFGFSANYTNIQQKGEGAAPAVAVGVPENTYNFTAFYEANGVMIRLSGNHVDGTQASGTNQNGITAAAFYSEARDQLDLSSSLELSKFNVPGNLQLTLDVINLTDAELRTNFQFSNAAYTVYKPGTTVMVGLRGQF
jgi:TonB-dependent receptor